MKTQLLLLFPIILFLWLFASDVHASSEVWFPFSDTCIGHIGIDGTILPSCHSKWANPENLQLIGN